MPLAGSRLNGNTRKNARRVEVDSTSLKVRDVLTVSSIVINTRAARVVGRQPVFLLSRRALSGTTEFVYNPRTQDETFHRTR